MTVYVQYQWVENEEAIEEDDEEYNNEINHPAIITSWNDDRQDDVADINNDYLIKRDWKENLAFKIITDNIMVVSYYQQVNTIYVTVQEV